MTDEQKQALSDYVQSLNFSYEATFQPRPQPVETVKNPQLHWLITLTKHPHVMQTNYRQGMAHVGNYKQIHKTRYDARRWTNAYRLTCETGKLCKVMEYADTPYQTEKPQPKPNLLDVLHCLVSDADVLNHTSFESWAGDLGYDTDSRKAEDIYRACLKNAHDLMPIIGGPKGLAKLQELFQDY